MPSLPTAEGEVLGRRTVSQLCNSPAVMHLRRGGQEGCGSGKVSSCSRVPYFLRFTDLSSVLRHLRALQRRAAISRDPAPELVESADPHVTANAQLQDAEDIVEPGSTQTTCSIPNNLNTSVSGNDYFHQYQVIKSNNDKAQKSAFLLGPLLGLVAGF